MTDLAAAARKALNTPSGKASVKALDVLGLLAEVAALRARLDEAMRALTEVRDMHQPMWVSEQAKAAGKEPWVCQLCGVADGGWPCDTRITVDEALAAAALNKEETT